MKKLNKAQKKLIKEKIMKILHIICYILSVLFILTMVIVGVQSCQKQPKKQSAETEYQLPHKAINMNDNYYVYQLIRDSDFSLSSIERNEINEIYDIPLGECNYNDPSIIKYIVYDPDNSGLIQVNSGNQLYNLHSLYAVFMPKDEINYYYRLSYIIFEIFLENGTLTSGNLYEYSSYDSNTGLVDYLRYSPNYNLLTLLINKEIISDDKLLYWYQLCEQSSFTFNKVFNYNAPINSNIQSPYGTGGNWTSSTSDTSYIDYETGYFISNGELYNKIRVYYFATGSMYFQYSDGNIKLGPSGSWSYMFLYYINTYTNQQILVNQRDLVAFMPSSSSHAYYNANSSTWVVDEYRYVIFLNDLSDTTRNKINAFNNNNQTSYSGYVGSGDITNVFSLVGSAFSGLLPILSTYLLPGITIGMLLFIPLVAMLVFAIIRIIKK